ncbi:MAG: hypothetical protein JRG70_15085 [Deltaproteobacteria bacterium]|nr:hypothetical protein [Deltaproteobacteria bacterium]
MKRIAGFVFLLFGTAWLGCSTSPDVAPTGYELRKEAFFAETINSESRNTYSEVMRLARAVAPDESKIQHDLDRMNDRLDTADFKLPAVLWMVYEYSDSELLSEQILRNAKDTILAFKYWPDELETEADPVDTDDMVYWTENHFILFSTGAYLAGQLYPNEVFAASGETGLEKMETFRPRIMRWLELRYQSGFSEWLSNVYYDEDIPALVALIELGEDEELRQLASIVLDVIFADMASNHFKGNFGSTHGRTYEHKMSGNRDNTGSAFKLLFDLNEFGPGNMSSSSLALSTTYQLPRVVYDMARDFERQEYENRQRMGIRLEEAASWGLDTSLLEDGMTFLTLEAYTHPLTIGLFVEMLDAYKWWEHADFAPFKDFEDVLRDETIRTALAVSQEKDLTRNMRPEVNIYTYRTPDYMLSTAQDWRKGYGGDQQSIWQATLGMDAVAFTTHPANESLDGPTPRYWVGYGTMPRAIQVKNVVISLYDVDTETELYVTDQPLYTHAFLPKDKFDDAHKEGGWFFARKGDGYLALWSSDPDADWLENSDPDSAELGDYEIIADGEKTIWICELARAPDYADFGAFKTAILGASLAADSEALSVDYVSPSQGRLMMDWDGSITQDGSTLVVGDFPRYDNPYSSSEFRGEVISFGHAGQSLKLDFANRSREVSRFLD